MMTAWVHCNVCYRLPSQNNKISFHLTSCGHLLCSNCNNVEQSKHCPICKRRVTVMEINRNLRADLQIFFRNPKDLLQQYLKNLRDVLIFQSTQRSRLNKARRTQENKMAKLMANAQAQLKRKADAEKAIVAEKLDLQKELTALKRRFRELQATLLALREAEAHKRTATPVLARTNRFSLPRIGLTERGERDGPESSFVATSTPNNDCQTVHHRDLRGVNTSLKHVAASFANCGKESSPIVPSKVLSTPDILGVKNYSDSSLQKDHIKPFVF
uniref:RING-type domain-containing protein n=1 Tax=Parascaris univalens TaxID=6257 RepID=A0A915ATW7_PARUN